MTRSDLILGTISTPSHTLSVDSAPFISLSSDSKADGALAVRLATTSSASSVLGVKQSGRGLLRRYFVSPHLGVFAACAGVCGFEHAKQAQLPKQGIGGNMDKSATYTLQMHFIFIHL